MKITDNVYSVGVVDKDVRIFHGYYTPIGTTYNSFLVLDEKITLIDFVKQTFTDEFLKNIEQVLQGRTIDYIICNHVEPDHSGALPKVMERYPKAMVYGTANCEKGLKAYYPTEKYDFTVVKLGDTLNTGKYNFKFIPMPMVHWPDSMSTYLEEEKILFSNDAFGQHTGTGEIFDTENGLDKLIDRAADYYANIVLPFGMQVGKLIASVSPLDIKTVCPSHGVIITKYLPEILQKYIFWSQNQTDDKKVLIVYDTMWGTTKKLAEQLNEEYKTKGFDVELINLSEDHYSHAMSRTLEAKYIFVGSPTLNNTMLPSVIAFLTYMKGLKPKGRIGKAFGSYGWSGESISQINDILLSCGFETEEPLKVMWNI
ncbi:FprA family A-type flavoprotein [Aminipila sp.]|uniref:FprA family A-type flavoprotein n=1 Tax=Aminipila sp. TaxID=2060095 RepID=UPI0028A1F83A|nr:FprA family A-type flavoprotein [Aminipila sp.]